MVGGEADLLHDSKTVLLSYQPVLLFVSLRGTFDLLGHLHSSVTSNLAILGNAVEGRLIHLVRWDLLEPFLLYVS